MDPEQTLHEMRYIANEIKGMKNASADYELQLRYDELMQRFEALDEWMTKGGFSPWPASSAPGEFSNGQPRMTLAQRNRLWELCERYNVPFREDDYRIQTEGVFGTPKGWVEGWIGGLQGNAQIGYTQPKTIYVGVSPEGESHS